MSEATPHIPETTSSKEGPLRSKRRLRRRLVRIGALILAGGLVALIGLAGNKQTKTTCWKLEVEVAPVDGHFFVEQDAVEKLVQSNGNVIVGKSVSDVNIAAIHERIMKDPAVGAAEVYTTVDGRCVIKVKQRNPIARFFNEDGSSFYIDRDGYVFPATKPIALKLPVFVGNIQENMIKDSVVKRREKAEWAKTSLLDDMYFLSIHIGKSEFLKALIDHIYIDGSRNVQLIPRVGDHKIVLGGVTNLNEKFKKLQTFYASALQTHDLNQFSTIHLEYKGQVVCEKKLLY